MNDTAPTIATPITPVVESQPVVVKAPTSKAAKIDAVLQKLNIETPQQAEAAFHVAATESAEAVVPSTPSETVEAPAEELPVVEAPKTAAQARKEFLAASKAARKAQEELKKVKAEKEQLEKFRSIDKWKEDPLKAVEEAGIDPVELYRSMTTKFISKDKPLDPVEEKIKAQVEPYVAALEAEKAQLAHHNEMVEMSNVIAQQVMPLVDKTEQYECLNAMFDGNKANAAIHVFNATNDHYQKTGELLPFDEVANQLESFYEGQLEAGIKRLISVKKFSSRFRSEEASTGTTIQAPEQQPKTNKTLTNKQTPSVSPPKANTGKAIAGNTRVSKEDKRINAVLNKFGIK